ncbi:hypothetical protein, partial [Streptomyces sp. NPDC088812]|uniref:hypothetical protein n=1 Tax=Streptomyces sp. NPDC088812 TaxID=3365905 RepID=UPI0038140AA1
TENHRARRITATSPNYPKPDEGALTKDIEAPSTVTTPVACRRPWPAYRVAPVGPPAGQVGVLFVHV